MNKIRIIKDGFRSESLIKFLTLIKAPKNFIFRMKDYHIDKDLDLSNKKPFSDLKILNSEDVEGFTCKVPMTIWKILDKEIGLKYIENCGYELIDNQTLNGFGTGQNVFWCNGEYIYSRNASLEENKLCKGVIRYNKKKSCAMLILNV